MQNIQVVRYQDKDRESWDSFVKNSRTNIFMFLRGYMDYHKDRFKDHSLLFYDGEELLALLPASSEASVLYSHGGLTFGGLITNKALKSHSVGEVFEKMLEYCKANGVTKILYKAVPYIYSSLPFQEDLYFLWRKGASLTRRDLSTTISTKNILKLPKGRKAQISRAKREGVIIESSFDFEDFIDLENQVLLLRHNSKATHTGKELKMLAERFPENIKLIVAKKDGCLIAGAVLYVYSEIVHTQYLATNEEGRTIGALDLIISEAIEYYKNEKTFFDFGISTEEQGKYLNLGLVSQKESFGGRGVVYDTYSLEVR